MQRHRPLNRLVGWIIVLVLLWALGPALLRAAADVIENPFANCPAGMERVGQNDRANDPGECVSQRH